MSVIIETSYGDLTFDLFTEQAPLAVQNFLKLCRLKFYNNCRLFEVQKDYLVRSGDPSNTGKSGDTVFRKVHKDESQRYFKSELNPSLKHNKFGILATANMAPDQNDSQFYITLSKRSLDTLDGKHTIFGELVEGQQNLEKINRCIVDDRNRPIQHIIILHTLVIDDPTPELDGFRSPSRSPSPAHEIRESGRIAANVDIDALVEGKTEEDLKEETKKHETKRNELILEILEDIPDADIKPPENVLFVCKLNPVTQERDLESLFRRFGVIKSVDLIRDQKTGDSLEYGFIEFEEQSAAIQAYFKMNNALVDQRRIKVDFSQSVAKLWYKYKGRRLQDYMRPSAVNKPRDDRKLKRSRSKERYDEVKEKKESRNYSERNTHRRDDSRYSRHGERRDDSRYYRENDRRDHRSSRGEGRDYRRDRDYNQDRNYRRERQQRRSNKY